MKRLFTLAILVILASCTQKTEEDRFLDDLMGRMTLEQKIGQMNLPSVGRNVVTGPDIRSNVKDLLREDRIGAVLNVVGAEQIRTLQQFAVDSSSLHIPLLMGLDVVHGYRTIFPVPLAIASTWDPKNAELCARTSAREATTQGISWTYAPMVDIAHDARWGRIMEGAGEDPLLGADFARAYVRGFQGGLDGAGDQLLACVKHYALYGASFGGLDYTAADMSRTLMFNLYMEPYRAAVEEGVASLMTCFNEVEGVPGCANEFLLRDVLRGMWSFDGFVVADYDAVGEMVKHGLGTPEEVTGRASNAGLDMDMCSLYFDKYLAQLVRNGVVKEEVVDRACRRILKAKYRLGLFKDPYRFCRPEEGKALLGCEEFRRQARQMAPESFVLLKNKEELLPLKRDARIALIGPYARESANVIGGWSCDGALSSPISLLEGLENAQASVKAAQGSNICYDHEVQARWTTGRGMAIVPDSRPDKALLQEAVDLARRSDVVVAALGETADLSGEGASRTDIRIPDAQRDLLKALVGTGKPVVLVLFTGRPLDLSWEADNVDAILNVWFPGTEAGNAIADVLFGDASPSGRLTASFPRSVGQLPYFYNHTPSGRPYKGEIRKFISTYYDESPEPLYPFGFGLSYTSFEYDDPQAEVLDDGKVYVEVAVRNTGKRPGREVVQLYVRDVAASQARPVCELKAYERITINPGESRTVHFVLDRDAFSFYNYSLQKVFEPGEFLLMTGPNCRDTRSVGVTLD